MPILRHAKKKLKVDLKRTLVNKIIRTKTKAAVDAMRQSPSLENLSKAFSALAKAAKKGVIHRGKADRLKSRLNKLVAKKLKA